MVTIAGHCTSWHHLSNSQRRSQSRATCAWLRRSVPTAPSLQLSRHICSPKCNHSRLQETWQKEKRNMKTTAIAAAATVSATSSSWMVQQDWQGWRPAPGSNCLLCPLQCQPFHRVNQVLLGGTSRTNPTQLWKGTMILLGSNTANHQRSWSLSSHQLWGSTSEH